MATERKRLRPGSAREQDDGMKLHLRELRCAGRTFRLVTLRPGTEAAFSTNWFHETWHVLCDPAGARLLGRLLWGLAYQRQPGTVVLLHGEHLCGTPFDGDPPNAMLLVPAHLTPWDRTAIEGLAAQLPRLGPPLRTVRWHTAGLDRALADPGAFSNEEWGRCRYSWLRRHAGPPWSRERVSRHAGVIGYSAPPPVLRQQALAVYQLGQGPYYGGMGYHSLAEGNGHPYGEGEVQVFTGFRREVREAVVARREVLARPEAPRDPEALRQAIYRQVERVRARARRPKR